MWGFTLTEILVVVSILAMLATVGMLQLLRARVIAYEELALTSVRQVTKACHFFSLVNQRFPADLTELGTANPPYIPANLMGDGFSAEKQGYLFTYASTVDGFTLNADPKTSGVTGVRHFFVDQNLAIHVLESGPAGPSDPVIP